VVQGNSDILTTKRGAGGVWKELSSWQEGKGECLGKELARLTTPYFFGDSRGGTLLAQRT